MTPVQALLITVFRVVNMEASNLDACNPANIDRLVYLDKELLNLRQQLEASGLSLNAAGEWK